MLFTGALQPRLLYRTVSPPPPHPHPRELEPRGVVHQPTGSKFGNFWEDSKVFAYLLLDLVMLL